MTRIAIVGPKSGVNSMRVVSYVRDLPVGTVVVSTGAKGVEETAAWAAEARSLETVVCRPDWDRFVLVGGRGTDKWAALDAMNNDIVDKCDEVHAFLHWGSRDGHVLSVAAKARRLGKTVIVRWDNGNEAIVPRLPPPLRASLARFLFPWEDASR
jgi:hypothetical protein